MKKPYQKPEILFDDFQLSTDIAAGCQLISQHAMYSCAVAIPGFDAKLFSQMGVGGCDMTPGDTALKPCYDVPVADNKVFSS